MIIKNKIKMIFVGAFPREKDILFGGNITSCSTLLEAGLSKYFELILLDSTQTSIPPPMIWSRLSKSVFRCIKYIYFLIRYNPDAILIFSCYGLSFLEKSMLSMIGRILNKRVLFFPRTGQLMNDCQNNFLKKKFTSIMLKIPNVILCQDETWREFYVNDLEIPKKRCFILRNWTATESLLRIGTERSYSIRSNEKLVILFLGWLTRSKGIFELIDAFVDLNHIFPNLELLIAGKGTDFDEANEYAKKKCLNDNIKFLGWVKSKQKLDILKKAKIFCLPSHVEGLPNSMIEAMAAGLPIIVTPVGCIPDVIQHNENGIITPLRDSLSLSKNIHELIQNQRLCEKIGRNAYRYASKEFTADKAIKKIRDLVDMNKN